MIHNLMNFNLFDFIVIVKGFLIQVYEFFDHFKIIDFKIIYLFFIKHLNCFIKDYFFKFLLKIIILSFENYF